MKLTYEDCKELKDAGFPQEGLGMNFHNGGFTTNPDVPLDSLYQPTLSELIEACGEYSKFKIAYDRDHVNKGGGWRATISKDITMFCDGSSPEQAVKNLYCSLNKK